MRGWMESTHQDMSREEEAGEPRFKPYTNTTMWCLTDPAEDDEKGKETQDEWRYLQESNRLVRMHHIGEVSSSRVIKEDARYQ